MRVKPVDVRHKRVNGPDAGSSPMHVKAAIPALAAPSIQRRSARRWALRAAALLLVVAIGGAVAGWLALRTPEWYRVPHIPETQRQQVRNNLLSAEQAMAEGLRRGQTFEYQLHQDDLNRWLTMRREIYPLAEEFIPPNWSDPIVRFDTGRITVAGRYSHASWSMIASIDIDVSFKDGEIVLTSGAVRSGSLPLPARLLGIPLDRPVERRAEKTWPGSPPINGDLAGGVRIGSRAWWKNGGWDYEVKNVSVSPGVLKLAIEPLGPHFSRDNSSQD